MLFPWGYSNANVSGGCEIVGRMPSLRASVVQSDCLAFLQSLPDASVDLIATDPAYSGMNRHLLLGRGRIVGDYRKAGGEDQKWFTEFQDDPDTFRLLLGQFHRVLKDQRHLYVMFDSFSLLTLGHLVRERFDVKNLIVWDKMLLGMGHHFRRRHELVLFASKGKRPLTRRDLPDVWRIRRIARAPYPTQKPVEVFEAMLCASVTPGFTVCDPFAGSGSAAIAALRQGCHFIGADISPRACRLANDRIARFSAEGWDPLQPEAAEDHHQLPFWRGQVNPSRRPRAPSISRTSAAPIRAQSAK
jgi:site-specific DNA-methyltransferase (adenine-specific)